VKALTWQQRAVLQAIRDHVATHGYPPSIREIGEAVGLASTSSVTHHLTVLCARGYIRRDERRPRALVIVDEVQA
jgi:repressor LexA